MGDRLRRPGAGGESPPAYPTLEFVPGAPFDADALVEVFLTDDAGDVEGNALDDYHGSFRTIADTSLTAPVITGVSPRRDPPLNSVIELAFNEALDPASVNTSTVILKDWTNARRPAPVEATVRLVRDGRVIRVVPVVALLASTPYFVDVDGVIDLHGTSAGFLRFIGAFRTGVEVDGAAPRVVGLSPPDGVTGVGVNAGLRVVFNESINPLTVNENTIQLSDGTGTFIACTIGDLAREKWTG